MTDDIIKRISIDCKATVNIGDYSRGGKTRGDDQAADHDMGCQEKYTPFGIVDEDTAQLALRFGSSAKTSDFIVDSLESWWEQLPLAERDDVTLLQIKLDNGPESSGRRTQFLHRMVAFADAIGIPIQPRQGKNDRNQYGWRLPMPLASRSSSFTTRLITANTIRSNGAGEFWSSTGTARNWWMSPRYSNGPKV